MALFSDRLCPIHPRARPLRWAYRIWVSAVSDERSVRFNLRLLAILTGVFSVPDLVQGLLVSMHTSGSGARIYGLYVLMLGLLELTGAVLLVRRSRGGRILIAAAAVGFYLEAALGLAAFERSLVAALVFAVCAPAEAWVLWFLAHPRVRAHVQAWRIVP